MKDSTAPAEDRPAAAPWVGPGAMLREARESKRLSIRAVADALHLSTGIIEGLEQERFDDLPPMTFVKGYLRAYGKLVDLPEDRLMEAFARLGVEESESPPDINANAEGSGSRAPSAAWLLLVLVVALAAGVGWWWYNQRLEPDTAAPQADSAESASAAEAPSPVADESVSPSQPEASAPAADAASDDGSPDGSVAGPDARDAPSTAGTPSTTESTPDPSSASTSGATATSEPAAGEAPASGEAATATSSVDSRDARAGTAVETGPAARMQEPAGADPDETASAPGGDAANGEESVPAREDGAEPVAQASLTLNVRGESWVDVRDATGARVLYGLISGPARRTVSGQPPFTLVLGEARTVELRYQGEPVALEPHIRGDVARFQWPPDS